MVSLICGDKLRQELSDFFKEISDEVIGKLKDLCVIHNLTEDVIGTELISFVIKYEKKELNLELIDDFQSDYLDKKAIKDYKKSKLKSNKMVKNNTSFDANKSFNSLLNGFTDECQKSFEMKPKLTTQIEIAEEIEECSDDIQVLSPVQEVMKTPEKVDHKIECLDVSSQSSPIEILDDTINKSLQLSQSSNILCYFGSSLSDFDWLNKSKAKLSVQPYDKSIALTEEYKFMSLKISESNEILNDLIDEFSENVRQLLDIDVWNRFSIPSPTESYYIGRVCCDSNRLKLNEHSIRLETSDYISNNESIGLDLTQLKSYSLFNGQIIACKAINESGKNLFLKEIVDLDPILRLPKPFPAISQALHLVVAVGPFTTPDSLSYEPLKKLMEYVKQHKPDFCILIGPFVDSYNKKLLTTEEPTDRIFNTQMRFISEELQDIKTEAIVIPSTRDLIVFNVVPTMPFNSHNSFNSYKSSKIHYLSNPTLININGVIIGLTATDVLLHLSQNEISSGQTSDRISRLCKHILNQRSFYPIFPPNPDINLEFTKYDFMTLPVTPHILVLPSDLKEFVKNICGSVVINSGRIFKNKFARIRVDPIDQKSFNGSLESYTNVEIIKSQ